MNSSPQLSRAGSATAEGLLLPVAGRAVPCLCQPLPTHLTSSHQHWPGLPSAPATLHLEPPGAAAFPFNKFPVSKKIHKTQFLEVNNSETSEKKQKLKPAQYQTDTKNMQLADACLASRGSTRSLHPRGPPAHWFESQNHHKLKEPSHASSWFRHACQSPAPAIGGRDSASEGTSSPEARSREFSPTVLSCQTVYNSTTIAQVLRQGQTD